MQLRTGSQGPSLETDKVAETVEQLCLLASFSWLALLAFLHSPDHPPRNGTAHTGLGENERLVGDQYDVGSSLTEVPSS